MASPLGPQSLVLTDPENLKAGGLEAQLDHIVDQLTPFTQLEEELDHDLFQPLKSIPHTQRLVAVDGSHRLLLDGRSFLIVALRSGAVTYQGDSFLESQIPMEVLFLERSKLSSSFKRMWQALADKLDLDGSQAPSTPQLQVAPERLRELGEWMAATLALEDLKAGDLLVMDGALRSPTNSGQAVLEALVQKASELGAGLVAVAKRSALSLGGLPLLPALERLAAGSPTPGAWSFPLGSVIQVRSAGEVWAVSFTPGIPTAFRVDVAGGLEPTEALARLGSYCSDILYPGYPHPLARVHNQVFLSAQDGHDMIQSLQSRTLGAGLPPGAWQMLFADFHNVLDRSV